MGSDFIPSYYVVLFLIIPGIVSLSQEIANTLLFVENEVKYRALIFISSSFLSIIIGTILAPSMGALGTAIGVCTALVICHIIGMNIVYSKVLKLKIGRFFKSVHLQMIWPMIVSGIVSGIIQYFYPVKNWYNFIYQELFLSFVCLACGGYLYE